MYRAYVGYSPVLKWLYTEAVLDWGAGAEVERETQPAPCTLQRKDWRGVLGIDWKKRLAGDLILGGRTLAKVREMLKGDRTEQKSLRALEKPLLDWDRITAAIQKLWGEPWEKISQRHGDPGRDLAMLIAQRYEV